MLTADLEYDLDPKHIAVAPADPRDAARLMVIHRPSGRILHTHVHNLPTLRADLSDNPQLNAPPLLSPNDLLVFNHSRVLPAYFTATRTKTGGQLTGLFLSDNTSDTQPTWTIMLESRGHLRPGESIHLSDGTQLRLLQLTAPGQWQALVLSSDDTLTILGRVGSPPLPPYIRRARRQLHLPEVDPNDSDRYNTVYAADPGSVAAPTAGLHFTQPLLDRLKQSGIRTAMLTLHVGIGTFAPVRTDRVDEHPIHPERIHIPRDTIAAIAETRRMGARVIPVGTTTVRALESLPDPLPPADFTTDTRLLIAPTPDGAPYPFRFTDALMTNFHLPRSTLLAMVAALPNVGIDRLKRWYQTAIDHDYRFYSYGDAMLIL